MIIDSYYNVVKLLDKIKDKLLKSIIMGRQETYTCQDCGFEFTEGDRNFFHDYNTNETVDYIHLFFNNWNLTILILIGLFPNHIASTAINSLKRFILIMWTVHNTLLKKLS